jgi:hypothetical protein
MVTPRSGKNRRPADSHEIGDTTDKFSEKMAASVDGSLLI